MPEPPIPVPGTDTLIHISIAVPLFSELRRVGSVERGKKCTTKGRKIRYLVQERLKG